jgi:hypothetical protein
VIAQYKLMQQYQLQARMRNWPGANVPGGNPVNMASMPNQAATLPAQLNAGNPQNIATNNMTQDFNNAGNRPRPIQQNIAAAQHPRPIMPRPSQYQPIAMAPPHPNLRPVNGMYRPIPIRPTSTTNTLPSSPHPPPTNG